MKNELNCGDCNELDELVYMECCGIQLCEDCAARHKAKWHAEALTVNDTSFSPDFHQWLATADLDDIYQEYSDSFKELHNIRPRWMYGRSRDEFARAFIQLGREYVAQDNEKDVEDECPMREADLDWIAANKYEALAGEPL